MIPDQILYASAHPFVDFKQALKTYESLPFNPDVRQKIMYDNAAKLLGLKTQATVPINGGKVQDLVGDIVRQVMQELKK